MGDPIRTYFTTGFRFAETKQFVTTNKFKFIKINGTSPARRRDDLTEYRVGRYIFVLCVFTP
jgi:hypothetical protein